jgi:hypothetical protein
MRAGCAYQDASREPCTVKIARVSYTDLEGVDHAVTVEARSLYHAVGIALTRFKSSVPACAPGPLTKFTVEPRKYPSAHCDTEAIRRMARATQRVSC